MYITKTSGPAVSQLVSSGAAGMPSENAVPPSDHGGAVHDGSGMPQRTSSGAADAPTRRPLRRVLAGLIVVAGLSVVVGGLATASPASAGGLTRMCMTSSSADVAAVRLGSRGSPDGLPPRPGPERCGNDRSVQSSGMSPTADQIEQSGARIAGAAYAAVLEASTAKGLNAQHATAVAKAAQMAALEAAWSHLTLQAKGQ